MSKSEREELLRHAMDFISRRELALRLHISPSALDEWISGKAPIPDGAMFVLLAGMIIIGSLRLDDRFMGVTGALHEIDLKIERVQR